MRTRNVTGLALAIVGGAMALPAFGAPQKGSSLGELDSVSAGQWVVRFRDGAADRRLCLRDGQALVQLRHTSANCERHVTEKGARTVTVQYSCGRQGHGRTSFRIENPGLVQIESQGIDNGRPFQFTAEARRTGSCR